MQYTNDPLADFDAYDKECRDWLNSLPKCQCCGQAIQDHYYFNFDGDNVCSECLRDYCEESFKVYR